MRLSLKKFHEKCAGKGDSFGYWYLLDKIFCVIYPAPIALGSKLRSRVGSVYSTFLISLGSLNMTQDFKIKLACSAGVLLVRANVKSSQSFIWPAMFDLELEWTVGVGGRGRVRRRLLKGESKTPLDPLDYLRVTERSFAKWQWLWAGVIFISPSPPLSFFLTVDHPFDTDFFPSPAFRCLWNERWQP